MPRRYRSPHRRRARLRRSLRTSGAGLNQRGALIAAGVGVFAAAGVGAHPQVVPAVAHAVTPHTSTITHASAGTANPALPANENLANQMAATLHGWAGQQTGCLDHLWSEESAGTWSPAVTNPTSGAYGIPQSLPASKMSTAGPDWQTNPATQIRWGLSYIGSRYGTPCAAWAFETSHVPNWY